MTLLALILLAAADEGVVLPSPGPHSWAAERPVCATPTPFINGSRSQLDPLGRGLWQLDEDRNQLTLTELNLSSDLSSRPSAQRRFDVGAWPQELLVTPQGRVFVSAREAGHLFVLDPDLEHSHTLPLATEPRSLALDVTRQRLFVGLVTAKEVVALDALSGAVMARLRVDAPPDFVVLSAAGLLVASRRSGVVSVFGPDFEARGTEVLEARQGVLGLGTRGSMRTAMANVVRPQTPAVRGFRLTPIPMLLGDSIAGNRQLGVVGLTADATRVAVVTEIATSGSSSLIFGGGGYGGGADLPIEHQLLTGLVEGFELNLASSGRVEGDPIASLVYQGRDLWLSTEAGTLIRFSEDRYSKVFSVQGDIVTALGVTPVGDGAVVATVEREDRSGAPIARELRFYFDDVMPRLPVKNQRPSNSATVAHLAPPIVDPELRRGRALFFSNRSADPSAGMACATCHPDGREDGRLWDQLGSLRQTPILSGRLADTAPYNWEGSSRTLDQNIHQTVEQRLGGRTLSKADTKALRRFVLEALRPVQVRPTESPELVSRGAELFADEEVGCAQCHQLDRGLTDGKQHEFKFQAGAPQQQRRTFAIRGLTPTRSFDTPSLKYLAASAPYFHDGTALSLESVITDNHDRMGVTSHLTSDEQKALVAYLETL